jgi:uncharacterized phage protein gp47/JayE
MESELQNGAAYLKASFENATAVVQAGLAHTLHGHLAFIARQVVPSTSEEEYLIEWAEFFLGAGARRAATSAVFPIGVTGTVDATIIPAGTVWSRGDGVTFTNNSPATLVGFEATIEVTAVVPGVASNTLANTGLVLTNPIVGVNPNASVEGVGLQGGGADIESLESLRQRMITFVQDPPKGGALGDYITWALAVPTAAITRAWELPGVMGPGTMLVLCVQDVFDADGFYVGTVAPAAAIIEAVRVYIEARKPVTAILFVVAPILTSVNLTISLDPNTPDVQIQVQQYLEDMFLRESAPGQSIALSLINEAISLAPGEDDHTLTVPVVDPVAANSQLLVLGSITFGDL